MKILIANDDGEYWRSSVARIACNQAFMLSDRGHEVFFLSTKQDDRSAEIHGTENFLSYSLFTRYPIRFRPCVSLYNPQVVPGFGKLLKYLKPDVVHFHNLHTYLSYGCLRCAARLGAKVFLTAHDAMLFCFQKYVCFHGHDSGIEKKESSAVTGLRCLKCQRFRYFPLRNAVIKRWVSRYATRIVSVSESLRAALMANGFENVITIHNGIEKDWLSVENEKVTAFKEKYNIEGLRMILAGGRLSYYKGLHHLLMAFSRLDRAETVLLIMGEGGRSQAGLQRLCAKLGVAGRVVFTGWLSGDDLGCAYAASTLCVNPSLCFETFSMFNLEAMMAKKPVISTRFGGPSEVVCHEKTGFLIDPRNWRELTQKMEFLISNPQLAAAMGKAGYQVAIEKFLADKPVRKLIELYESF